MPGRALVIGGGLAGLTAAGRLRDAGRDVVVVDKGRRPGGRANTREHDMHRFDHGAQFFTVRDPRVTPLLDDWLHTGLVAPWEGRLVRIEGDTINPAKPFSAARRPVQRHIFVQRCVRDNHTGRMARSMT